MEPIALGTVENGTVVIIFLPGGAVHICKVIGEPGSPIRNLVVADNSNELANEAAAIVGDFDFRGTINTQASPVAFLCPPDLAARGVWNIAGER